MGFQGELACNRAAGYVRTPLVAARDVRNDSDDEVCRHFVVLFATEVPRYPDDFAPAVAAVPGFEAMPSRNRARSQQPSEARHRHCGTAHAGHAESDDQLMRAVDLTRGPPRSGFIGRGNAFSVGIDVGAAPTLVYNLADGLMPNSLHSSLANMSNCRRASNALPSQRCASMSAVCADSRNGSSATTANITSIASGYLPRSARRCA